MNQLDLFAKAEAEEELQDHIEGWGDWRPAAGGLCEIGSCIVRRVNPLLDFWGPGEHRDSVYAGGCHAVLMHEESKVMTDDWDSPSPAWVAKLLPPLDRNWLTGEITQEVEWALTHYGFSYQDLFEEENDGLVFLRAIDMTPPEHQAIQEYERSVRARFFHCFGEISDWSQVAQIYASRGRRTRRVVGA